MVEQWPFKPLVESSSLSGPTNFGKPLGGFFKLVRDSNALCHPEVTKDLRRMSVPYSWEIATSMTPRNDNMLYSRLKNIVGPVRPNPSEYAPEILSNLGEGKAETD